MPNTNFQTIHQMDGAINSFIKQATGRDAVQNIDMEHITVAQNHYYEDVGISGRVVSFNAGAAGIPLEKCLVHIEPVQEGEGDPSPDNVRPITGWTGAKVTRTGKNLYAYEPYQGETYDITFPSEAGTVYGGTLDVTTGKLVVDRAIKNVQIRLGDYNKTINALLFYSNRGIFSDALAPANNNTPFYAIAESTNVNSSSAINGGEYGIGLASTKDVYLRAVGASSKDDYLSIFPNGINVVYKLATPTTYQLTPQEVRTLLGQNNIWADTGDIEVKFKNIKEFF